MDKFLIIVIWFEEKSDKTLTSITIILHTFQILYLVFFKYFKYYKTYSKYKVQDINCILNTFNWNTAHPWFLLLTLKKK